LSALRDLDELEIELLAVVNPEESVRGLVRGEDEAREHNLLATYLREVQVDIGTHLGLEATTKVLHGLPSARIGAEAEEFRADLLIISTHGRSGVSRWRIGSVADKVVRAATCNVLVIGPRAAEAASWYAEFTPAFRSILVPLDGSDLAEQALPLAVQFAERFDSTLHLVQVVSVPIYGGLGETVQPDTMSIVQESAESYLSSIAKRISRPDVKTSVRIGSVAIELSDYVSENRIELVAMTTHGRGGVVRTALGSVTDRLLGLQAPVLVVRPT
jgi:nucleotide-binding universal stress UspA family protein